MSRIDYSKWDKLDYSSSSSEDGKSEETAMREKAIRAMEMLLLRETSSSPLWNGLVKHHKDIFVACASEIEQDGSDFLFKSE